MRCYLIEQNRNWVQTSFVNCRNFMGEKELKYCGNQNFQKTEATIGNAYGLELDHIKFMASKYVFM